MRRWLRAIKYEFGLVYQVALKHRIAEILTQLPTEATWISTFIERFRSWEKLHSDKTAQQRIWRRTRGNSCPEKRISTTNLQLLYKSRMYKFISRHVEFYWKKMRISVHVLQDRTLSETIRHRHLHTKSPLATDLICSISWYLPSNSCWSPRKQPNIGQMPKKLLLVEYM